MSGKPPRRRRRLRPADSAWGIIGGNLKNVLEDTLVRRRWVPEADIPLRRTVPGHRQTGSSRRHWLLTRGKYGANETAG